MIIGNKKYECIVIAGDDNEVLAIIDDENIVAKKNIIKNFSNFIT